jgi:cob(I)alamin adenosyltransferase
MIIVFTGNGKGKTTASLGQMIRVIGRGKNALMLQFIKGPWRSGEDDFSDFFQKIKSKKIGEFKIKKGGLGFVKILGDKLPFSDHKKAAQKTFAEFKKELKSNKWHLIILDEINVAINLKLLNKKEVISAIRNFPEDKILILTGRGAPKEFVKIADLVTEMKEIKHPFLKGKQGKVTIEF